MFVASNACTTRVLSPRLPGAWHIGFLFILGGILSYLRFQICAERMRKQETRIIKMKPEHEHLLDLTIM